MKAERREFRNARFSPEVIKEAAEIFDKELETEAKEAPSLLLSVDVDDARRDHDSEAEFYADYRRSEGTASYTRSIRLRDYSEARLYLLAFTGTEFTPGRTDVSISAPQWSQVVAVMDVFTRNLNQSLLPEVEAEEYADEPIIFIGHGQSSAWKELYDHLRDKHGFEIEAYEIGARAGHTVRDILELMLEKSSMVFSS